MSDDTLCFIRRKDGTRVIGAPTSLGDLPGTHGEGQSNTFKEAVNTLRRVMSGFPHLGMEGNTSISIDEFTEDARKGVPSMARLAEISRNTNRVLTKMREELAPYDPCSASDRRYVREGFDSLVDTTHNWVGKLGDAFGRVDSDAGMKVFGQSDEFLKTDFMSDITDGTELHETITNVMKQYCALGWQVKFIDATKDVYDGQLTLGTLRFRQPKRLDHKAKFTLQNRKSLLDAATTSQREMFRRSQNQLNRLSDRIHVPQRTFEQGTPYWIDLGTYAPSFDEWRSAVDEVRTQGWSKIGEIIRGWPGGEDYAKTYLADPLKFSKKKKRSSRKKSVGTTLDDEGQTMTEGSHAAEIDALPLSEPAKGSAKDSETKLKASEAVSASAADKSTDIRPKKVTALHSESQSMDQIRDDLLKEFSRVRTLLAREDKQREHGARQKSAHLSEGTSAPSTDVMQKPSYPSAESSTRRGKHPSPYSFGIGANPTYASRRRPVVVPRGESAVEVKSQDTRALMDVFQWPPLGNSELFRTSTEAEEAFDEDEEEPTPANVDAFAEGGATSSADAPRQEWTEDEPDDDDPHIEERFTLESIVRESDLDIEGVDPEVISHMGRFAQFRQDQNPDSFVTVNDLVRELGGWSSIVSHLSREDGESSENERSV